MNDKNSQRNRILRYLTDHKEGAYIYEFTRDMGIYRYSARIHELRKDGHDVRMDRPGHYYLHTEPVQANLC